MPSNSAADEKSPNARAACSYGDRNSTRRANNQHVGTMFACGTQQANQRRAGAHFRFRDPAHARQLNCGAFQ
jgi:hypothetical protein